MPVFRLRRDHVFPDPRLAHPSGVIAHGGDLHPDRVLLAYANGIFPWYSDDSPLFWYSPDPRFVLPTDQLKLQRSLKKRIRRAEYRITLDTSFADVLRGCATVHRPDQDGTWLTEDLQAAFRDLHRRGYAHSVEAWRGDELVGGLYGIAIGQLFCGESMFATASDASKVAFAHLVRQLERWGTPLVDCQIHTPHLERFGAFEVPRERFLADLATLRERPQRPGPWTFDADLTPQVVAG